MNQMMCKEININRFLYKTMTTINFYSKGRDHSLKVSKLKKNELTRQTASSCM